MLWFLLTLVLLGVLLVVSLHFFSSFPYVSFFLKGHESGFRFSEINLLRKTAVQVKLRDPGALFWSEKSLDRCIRGIVIFQRRTGTESQAGAAEFLGKLLEFRKRVEFNLPRHRMGLTSTRSILPGQSIKIALPGEGLFVTRVVENHRKYLVINQPPNPRIDKTITWNGLKVKVYFWRLEDAGYYFESRIISPSKDISSGLLHMIHSDGLIRTQKRSTIRVGLNQKGRIFPLETMIVDETWNDSGGLLCRLIDISESGAGIGVKGRGKIGMLIKLQTVLADMPVILCGSVKSVNYNEKQHASILHLEAIAPSRMMKNRILSYVFGIVQDDLPVKPAHRDSESLTDSSHPFDSPEQIESQESMEIPDEMKQEMKDDSIEEPNVIEYEES